MVFMEFNVLSLKSNSQNSIEDLYIIILIWLFKKYLNPIIWLDVFFSLVIWFIWIEKGSKTYSLFDKYKVYII